MAGEHLVARAGDGFCASAAPDGRANGSAAQTGHRTLAAMKSTWSAPAKLNLMLHVVGRRPDGYHELQTVFQLIDLCDSLEIGVREDGVICRPGGPPGVPEADDLTVRAARALKSATGSPLGADISIK